MTRRAVDRRRRPRRRPLRRDAARRGFDGRVMLVGEEPVAPYERPALSKEFLAGDARRELAAPPPDAYWDDAGIELVLGTASTARSRRRASRATDRGAELRWDVLVLATGRARRAAPLERRRASHELRTLADARALRSRARARLAPRRRRRRIRRRRSRLDGAAARASR